MRHPVERIGIRADEPVQGFQQAGHRGLRIDAKTAQLPEVGDLGGVFHRVKASDAEMLSGNNGNSMFA